MAEQRIPVSRFKAECLALFEEVAQTGRPLVITKRGRPIARVVAIQDSPSLIGSVTLNVSEEDFIAPVDVV